MSNNRIYLVLAGIVGFSLVFLMSSCEDAPISTSEILSLVSETPDLLVSGNTPSATWPFPTVETISARPSPTFQPVEGSVQRTQYRISATLDYLDRRLVVSQTIDYTNQYSFPISSITLIVEPNRKTNTFHLNDLGCISGHTVQEYQLEGARLIVPFEQPISPGQSVSLSLHFEVYIPNQSGPFGYDTRQINLGDWYPFIPPYREEEGWMSHNPALVGEHLAYDVADYLVDIYIINSPDDFIVAASAPVTVENSWYEYNFSAARNFSLSISKEYEVLTGTADSILVIGYVFPEHIIAGQAAVSATIEALSFFSEMYGPYPHQSLAVVEASFPDGMEYDGLYFLGEEYFSSYSSGSQNYLTALAVHETAHQWWYGSVGNDQAMEPWLDESLATYSEVLFYEKTWPDLVNWWWDFRIVRFNPSGWVNSTIYTEDTFRTYVNATYLRGALFLQHLRETIGDELFFSFIRDYATTYALDQVTADDFFCTLAQHAQVDYDMLMKGYFLQDTSSPVGEWEADTNR